MDADSKIDELTKALKHAQEALFWYPAEGFELDGQPVGIVVEQALVLVAAPCPSL